MLYVSNGDPAGPTILIMKYLHCKAGDSISLFNLHPRNRSLHGDVVAVQLLPKAQWRSRSGKLADSTGSSSDVMATGVVVGVILRNEKEYVASFEVRILKIINKSGPFFRLLVYGC